MAEHTRSHPAVRVCVGKFEAEIDVEIAPLILAMWLAGIKTHMSCQGDSDGEVWIEFKAVKDLERFLTAVCPHEDDDPALYCRIVHHTYEFEPWWEYDLFPLDYCSREFVDELNDETLIGAPPQIILHPSVRFPRSDLAQVEQRMAAFNHWAAA